MTMSMAPICRHTQGACTSRPPRRREAQVDWPRSGDSNRRRHRRLRTAATLAALALAGCRDSVGPEVATIEVTSDVNTIIAAGGNAHLTALARTQSGRAVTATFTWTSSNPTVATVSSSGLVQGVAAGNATISAAAGGSTGSLALHVVAADLDAIRVLLTDPLRPHLVTRLISARNSVEAALATADQSVTSGNIVALNQSLSAVANQASAATNPDDRALLATLALLTDFAIRLLHL